MFPIIAAATTAALLVSPACVGLTAPVPDAVVAWFAPVGSYAGHWGIDYETPSDRRVRAAAPGWVSFSGTVAGNRTVTIDHGGGLKTSYSYLDEIWVGRGAYVDSGSVVGTAGRLHFDERSGVHFSTRIDGIYVDPRSLLGCPDYAMPDALRLVPVP